MEANASSKQEGVSPWRSIEPIKMGSASCAAGPIFPMDNADSQRTESRGSCSVRKRAGSCCASGAPISDNATRAAWATPFSLALTDCSRTGIASWAAGPISAIEIAAHFRTKASSCSKAGIKRLTTFFLLSGSIPKSSCWAFSRIDSLCETSRCSMGTVFRKSRSFPAISQIKPKRIASCKRTKAMSLLLKRPERAFTGGKGIYSGRGALETRSISTATNSLPE